VLYRVEDILEYGAPQGAVGEHYLIMQHVWAQILPALEGGRLTSSMAV